MKRLAFVSLAALAWADLAAAQTTDITPDTAPQVSLGTTISQTGNVHTIDGGTRAGNNLFHSFQTFSLGTGHIARWTHSSGNPVSIANVINRVTGGDPSHIFGELDSTGLPHANFFFINPAGIVFGAGAQVNVPAAAHFSTASELRFESGPAFSVATPGGSTLSVAAPQAFGFIGGEGNLIIEESGVDFLPNRGELSLSATGIGIFDTGIITSGLTLTATGGALVVGLDGRSDAAATGTVLLSESALIGVPAPSRAGHVQVLGGNVMVSGGGLGTVSTPTLDGGSIFISADTLEIDNVAMISTFSESDRRAGNVFVSARAIGIFGDSAILSRVNGAGEAGSIDLSAQDIWIDDSRVASESYGSAGAAFIGISAQTSLTLMNNASIGSDSADSGGAGAIIIETPDLLIINGSSISSDSLGSGDAGQIFVTAERMRLLTDSSVSSDALGSGTAGGVQLLVNDVEIGDVSYVSSDSFGDARFGGGVLVEAANISLWGFSYISADALGEGDGGLVLINATGTVDVGTFSSITSSANGAGWAGDIVIAAGNVLISDGSRVASESYGDGNGGYVGITAVDAVEISDFSSVTSNSRGSGWAGNVEIAASTVRIFDSNTASESFGNGDGGSIQITATDAVEISNASIRSNAWGSGWAGGIFIAGNQVIAQNSAVESQAIGTGNAGSIDIEANDLILNETYLTTDVSGEGFSGGIDVRAANNIYAEASTITANRGFIDLTAGNRLDLIGSHLLADSFGSGEQPGGAIYLTAGDLVIDGTAITADNFAAGDFTDVTGLISIRAARSLNVFNSVVKLETYGAGAGGNLSLFAPNVLLSGSLLSSSTYGSGNAGDVFIGAEAQLAVQSSTVSSLTNDAGHAGFIDLRAPALTLASSFVTSSTGFFADADAGFIFINADTLSIAGSELETNTSGPGDAGYISIRANRVDVADSRIASDTYANGQAGGVFIVVAQQMNAGPQTTISSDTYGAGHAGDVSIDTARLTITGGELGLTYITSDSLGSGNAGNVLIAASESLRVSEFAFISSDAYLSGNAGFVEIDAGDVIIESGGRITSRAMANSTGHAGQVFIISNTLDVNSGGSVSSSTEGAGDAGGVLIDTGRLRIDDGSVSSSAALGASGASGGLSIIAGESVTLVNSGRIETQSTNANPAGFISIYTPELLVSGVGSAIGSENSSPGGGDAGFIHIETSGADARGVTILEGGRITTNSAFGEAGNITLEMAPTSVLLLQGRSMPGVIETSSGPGTGGVITIRSPLAIVMNGGSILALGQSGGANVDIDTPYYITSSDRVNRLEVDGNLVFANAIYDVSAGIVNPDLSVLDASGVLRGQCPAMRSTGQLSQLTLRPIGPYAPRLPESPPPPDTGPGGLVPGGCL